ncbi:Dynein intermediate chain 2 [Durusdinium trenchii]|uniref:Ciliary n=1 Tax=Durusdinium trenchii TaxID=1381693 RepID=A0ABP0KEW3_9DINO
MLAPQARKKGGESRIQTKAFGDHLIADHVVVRANIEEGSRGERVALVVKDLHTKFRSIYPSQSKSSDEVVIALQHFVAPDDAVEVIYTDNSRELIAGIKELGYRHQTSVEYVDSSKSFIEREVRNMLEGARTNLVQSGMPLQYWPLAIQHFAMATNTSDQLDSSPSPWELRFGEMFEGMAIPFGAKVLFWNNPNRADNTAGKLSPTSVEGVFLGYHVQPGHKWRGELVAYIHHTKDRFLDAFIGDPLSECQIWLFADADWAGDEEAKSECMRWLDKEINTFKQQHPKAKVLLYGSLPCTGGSPWGNVNKQTEEGLERIKEQQKEFTKLFKSFAKLVRDHLDSRAFVAFELSRRCRYWHWPSVLAFIKRHNLQGYNFDGCMFGVRDNHGIDFPRHDPSTYLVGTEEGLVAVLGFRLAGRDFRCEFAIFGTGPLLTFQSTDLYDAVNDVVWAPQNSTSFAAAMDDGRIELWDLAEKPLDPIVVHYPQAEKPQRRRTCVRFSPNSPVLVAGALGGRRNAKDERRWAGWMGV